MKFLSTVAVIFVICCDLARATDVGIPERDADLIKSADAVEVTGTSDSRAPEAFTIHDRKAILQFADLLTSDRYTAVPKSLKPKFKAPSSYKIRLMAGNSVVMELQVIGDSILDIPSEPMFYMESESYSENLMAPLLRLR